MTFGASADDFNGDKWQVPFDTRSQALLTSGIFGLDLAAFSGVLTPVFSKLPAFKTTTIGEHSKPMKTHQEVDQRSLALHRLMAQKIRSTPILFEQVKQTLARLQVIVCPSSQPYLDEWASLVQSGAEDCLKVAEEDSEHAAALRQSSPFGGVLTNQERFAFLNSWDERHETR